MLICQVGWCHKKAQHDPCCSSHDKLLCCYHYRRFHFVEVRPCCGRDED